MLRPKTAQAGLPDQQETTPPTTRPKGWTRFEYGFRWRCPNCGRGNDVFVDRFAAAFTNFRDQMSMWCAGCGTTAEPVGSQNIPPLDAAMLRYWCTDPTAKLGGSDDLWGAVVDLAVCDTPKRTLLDVLVDPGHLIRDRAEVLAVELARQALQAKEPTLDIAVLAWCKAHRDLWDHPRGHGGIAKALTAHLENQRSVLQ